MPDTPTPPALAPDRGACSGRRRQSLLRRRLRRRALVDALLALLLVPGAMLLSADPNTQLRLAIVASGFAMLAFMVRRAQDLADVRADIAARDAAMAGRGISIGQWHSGQPLPPWSERATKSDS